MPLSLQLLTPCIAALFLVGGYHGIAALHLRLRPQRAFDPESPLEL
jgi:hypothetical protein